MRFGVEISGKISLIKFLLMDQSQPVESTVVGRPRLWVGPLVAGCCFAMGFGITDRVVNLQSDIKPVQTQRFAPSYFPGDSLQTLRSIHEGDASLQVDLAARKLASPELDAATTPPVATASEANLALQLPLSADKTWTAPAWSDPDVDVAPSAMSTELIRGLDPEPDSASVLLVPPPEVLPPAFVSENDAQRLLPLQPLMPPSQP
jgi:hypothetical protein